MRGGSDSETSGGSAVGALKVVFAKKWCLVFGFSGCEAVASGFDLKVTRLEPVDNKAYFGMNRTVCFSNFGRESAFAITSAEQKKRAPSI